MPPVGFEPTVSVGERPQTYALDCAATGTGIMSIIPGINLRRMRCAGHVACVAEKRNLKPEGERPLGCFSVVRRIMLKLLIKK